MANSSIQHKTVWQSATKIISSSDLVFAASLEHHSTKIGMNNMHVLHTTTSKSIKKPNGLLRCPLDSTHVYAHSASTVPSPMGIIEKNQKNDNIRISAMNRDLVKFSETTASMVTKMNCRWLAIQLCQYLKSWKYYNFPSSLCMLLFWSLVYRKYAPFYLSCLNNSLKLLLVPCRRIEHR